MIEADGVVLVYNPDTPTQDQQLSDWYDFFVKKNNLKEEQCLIFAHRSNPNGDRFKPRKIVLLFFFFYRILSKVLLFNCLAPLFSRVSAAVTSSESGSDVQNMFDNFIKDVSSNLMRK